MLVQEAAFKTKRDGLDPPACPDPTDLLGESGPGQAAAPQSPDDIARPEAEEKGAFCPPRQILGLWSSD